MDFGTAAITAAAFALGGLFNALVGAATAEYRARKDTERQLAGDKRDRLRADRLAELERAKRYMYGELLFRRGVLSRSVGLIRDSEVAKRRLLDEWPRYDLIGDEEVLAKYFRMVQDMEELDPRSGYPDEIARRWGNVEGHLLRAVLEQRERILNDEDFHVIPWTRVTALEGGYEAAERRRREGIEQAQASTEPPASAPEEAGRGS